MTVAERMLRCRVIEKIEQNENYAKKLGLVNNSSFREDNKACSGNKLEREVGK